MERYYRDWVSHKDLVNFNVKYKDSDLSISAESNFHDKARHSLISYRKQIQNYISSHPDFETSLEYVPSSEDAPFIIKEMCRFSKKVNIGPMASVAGAISEFVGKDLSKYSSNVIVENGGDIYVDTTKERIISIYAGESPLSGKIGIKVSARSFPYGVCTSSATVGHSLSFGTADAVVAISPSSILSDAVATAACNRVKKEIEIEESIDYAKGVEEVKGVIIIRGKEVGSWGEIELVKLNSSNKL